MENATSREQTRLAIAMYSLVYERSVEAPLGPFQFVGVREVKQGLFQGTAFRHLVLDTFVDTIQDELQHKARLGNESKVKGRKDGEATYWYRGHTGWFQDGCVTFGTLLNFAR